MSEQIDTALRWAREAIAEHSESARLDAELLLAHCLEKPRSYLYAHPDQPLAPATWERFRQLVRRRLEPVAELARVEAERRLAPDHRHPADVERQDLALHL